MAPPKESHPNSDYNYFILAVAAAAVAVLLLVTNVLAVGCFSCFGILRAITRLLRSLGVLAARSRDDEERISRLMPARKYRKEHTVAADESGCAVCLAAFEEGEDVRQMPECKHSFHAPCIDAWLSAHASCPLCRTNVLPPPLWCPMADSAQRGPVGPAGGMTGVVVLL